MKKIMKILLIPVLAVTFLGSCAENQEGMQRFDSDAATCTPIKDIVDLANSPNVYRLTIDEIDENEPTNVKRTGIITWVVEKVTGVIKNASLWIYLKIALNLDFRFLVATMMTLSVILFAASVLLGLIQANGYNALVFILKLVIIYHLSINYVYFYTYVIQTFEALVSDTMMFSSLTFSDYIAVDPTIVCLGLFGQACDIANIVGNLFGNSDLIGSLTGMLGIGDAGVRKFFLFNAFDDTISKFFDVRMWKLTLALAGTGMTGMFWAVMLFLMNILYLFAVIAAVKVYLLSYIARWALYGLGPIFISFALFKQTKSLFDGWLQQLISFTLQPVMLFIFLGMFQSMISGFTSQLYVNIGDPNNSYDIKNPCDPNSGTCQEEACNGPQPGCIEVGGTWKRYFTPVSASGGAMCVKWDKFDNQSGKDLYWYKICQQTSSQSDNCSNSTLKPMIPIDIWMVMAIIIICYLMFAMCSWVTEVANSLASGAMSISGVKIMGWDRVKQGISSGAGTMFKSALSSGGGAARGASQAKRK